MHGLEALFESCEEERIGLIFMVLLSRVMKVKYASGVIREQYMFSALTLRELGESLIIYSLIFTYPFEGIGIANQPLLR